MFIQSDRWKCASFTESLADPVLLTEPAEVGDVSRDPGLPAGQRGWEENLEEGLLLPAALRTLLLHQGLVQGQRVCDLRESAIVESPLL